MRRVFFFLATKLAVPIVLGIVSSLLEGAQGVLNSFVLLFSRVIGDFVDRAALRDERGPGIGRFAVTILAQIVPGILATIIGAGRSSSARAAGASTSRRSSLWLGQGPSPGTP